MQLFVIPRELFAQFGGNHDFTFSTLSAILTYSLTQDKMYIPENWIPFVIAILLPMLLGSLWYGPIFGKIWMEMMDLTEEKIRENLNPIKSYGGSLVGSVLTVYVISLLIAYMDMGTLGGGLTVGFAVWVGFVLPIGWQSVAWEDKAMGVFVLNQAYNLIVFLLMGGLIGVWR